MDICAATLETLVQEHGFPLYVYDHRTLLNQIWLLTSVFQNCTILYSMKTNPFVDICKSLIAHGAGIDAASRGEVHAAHRYGLPKEAILYSAPGKTDADIAETIDICTLIADSCNELRRLDSICGQRGITVSAGLRISPNFAYGPGACPPIISGIPDKFGEAEEALCEQASALRCLKHIRLAGFHVYVRSQVLSAETLARCFEHVFALAGMWVNTLGFDLDFINMGGGFGVPYKANTQSIDFIHLQRRMTAMQRSFRAQFVHPVKLYLESGRYLVAKAGTFVTRIVDIKKSRGTTFVIAPGIMNAFLRPAMAGLLAHLPQAEALPSPLEPLWSGHTTYLPKAYGQEVPRQVVTICGNLCTNLDTACRNIALENVAIGNLLTFENAGAYAATLSPQGFSSYGRPAEVLI